MDSIQLTPTLSWPLSWELIQKQKDGEFEDIDDLFYEENDDDDNEVKTRLKANYENENYIFWECTYY